MKVLCKTQHSGCIFSTDDFNTNNSVIKIKRFEKGGSYSGRMDANCIIFIMTGSGVINARDVKDFYLEKGTAILLPIGSDYSLKAEDHTHVVICRLDESVRLCDIYTFESLLDDIDEPEKLFKSLEINEKLWAFLTSTLTYMDDGLVCRQFLQLKLTELFYLFKAYYPQETLAEFFLPLITKDAKFANFIYDNWDKVKTLNELASMYNLSLSGFTKKFKKVFGTAPYKWIMDKKGELIYNDLRSAEKSIKQMSVEYNFCSVQHFCDYCKKKFGMSPGKIRQGLRKQS